MASSYQVTPEMAREAQLVMWLQSQFPDGVRVMRVQMEKEILTLNTTWIITCYVTDLGKEVVLTETATGEHLPLPQLITKASLLGA